MDQRDEVEERAVLGETEPESSTDHGLSKKTKWSTFLLAYSSLGIIYGDIGTSPLYCFATTLYADGQAKPSKEDIMGVSSLIFWIMTLVVLVKYVLIVLRADDNGEGGTFALYSLLCRSIGLTPFGAEVDKADCELRRYSSTPAAHHRRGTKQALEATVSCLTSHWLNKAARHAFRHRRSLQMALLLTVVLSTAMVVGDGILTPSISVLGAVSGLQVATDNITLEEIVGISVVVLVVLFTGQFYGTSLVGQAFAPIVIIWLSMNAGVGVYNLVVNGGEIFASLNPWEVVKFFMNNGQHGWLMLGGVILCITGAEAMYSDLGHFNRKAVSLGFITFVYPCLMLTYWGQGAYLLAHPDDAHEAFWRSVPQPMFWPMFVAAILASTVASQALITGAFSIMRQASMLGLFPKLTVLHTGHDVEGQIYMPEVNYTLMVLTIAVTAGFQSPHQLGEAYGVAVMSVMTMTTLLLALVMLITWNLHPAIVALFLIVYLPMEGAFLSATLVKIPSGGWVALVVAFILGGIKLTWWWGTRKKHNYTKQNQAKLYSLLKEITEPLAASSDSILQQQQQKHQNHQLQLACSVAEAAITSRECSSAVTHCQPGTMLDPVRPLLGFKPQKRQVVLQQSGEPVARMPGMGVYYAENSTGVPAVMRHVLETMPALYSSMVFMTVRFVAVPSVDPEERFLAWRDKSISGCYHVVVRYGYVDRVDHSRVFMESLVLQLLKQILERKAIGSPGAAQRLLTALAAKAASKLADHNFHRGSSVKVPEFPRCRRRSARHSTISSSGGVVGVGQVCTAANALAKAAAEAAGAAEVDEPACSRTSTAGVLGSLLEDATSAELAGILALNQRSSCDDKPGRQSFAFNVRSSSKGKLLDNRCAGVQSLAAAQAAIGNMSSSGGEVLACITLKVNRDIGTSCNKGAETEGAGIELATVPAAPEALAAAAAATQQQNRPRKTTSLLAGLQQRASAILVKAASEDEPATLQQRQHQRPESDSCEEDLTPPARMPSYWFQLNRAGEGDTEESDCTDACSNSTESNQGWDEIQNPRVHPDSAHRNPAEDRVDFSAKHGSSNSTGPATNEEDVAAAVPSAATPSVGESARERATIPTSKKATVAFTMPAMPLSADGSTAGAAAVINQAQLAALHEAIQLLQAYQRRWVHCVGRTTLKVLPGGMHRVVLGGLYRFLAVNSRQVTAAWCIPTHNLIELGMDVEVD